MGVVIEAAPIVKWTVGKNATVLREWLKKKGALLDWVELMEYDWEKLQGSSEHPAYWSVKTDQCEIIIEPRPHYCDRGRMIAKVFPVVSSELMLKFDGADGWPRYYYDLDRAKAE